MPRSFWSGGVVCGTSKTVRTYVRDVTFGEDAFRIRTDLFPKSMSRVRNAPISLLRALKIDNIAAAVRESARNPQGLFTTLWQIGQMAGRGKEPWPALRGLWICIQSPISLERSLCLIVVHARSKSVQASCSTAN